MRPLPSPVIVTRNERMRSILDRVTTAAGSESAILLMGETGVGKELFADYVHRTSPRRDRPFVKISLSAMPHDLLESELFGHEKGAFTNAFAAKKGLFELADSGSLFLDDIDDVPQSIQPKLLRVLESREVFRVGGTSTVAIDVRLITASKVDLRELVARNLFRADLFYRINVLPVEIPALRERREDIELLIGHFLDRFAAGQARTVAPAALRLLREYDWPGNIRELRNIIQRLALFSGPVIGVDDLPAEIRNGIPADLLARACGRCLTEESMTFSEVVECLERNLLCQTLEEAAGNRSQAARTLGMSLSTLRDKLRKYGLNNAG